MESNSTPYVSHIETPSKKFKRPKKRAKSKRGKNRTVSGKSALELLEAANQEDLPTASMTNLPDHEEAQRTAVEVQEAEKKRRWAKAAHDIENPKRGFGGMPVSNMTIPGASGGKGMPRKGVGKGQSLDGMSMFATANMSDILAQRSKLKKRSNNNDQSSSTENKEEKEEASGSSESENELMNRLAAVRKKKQSSDQE
eukprot:gb/GECH01010961.1/.p1 GENE.gb/GECH01010961.1/~~gb/GECH01010961.1/.p1  ORF type:complete len:198 (+),score=66.91 gb/GECH01010961.1/:1-594(+)